MFFDNSNKITSDIEITDYIFKSRINIGLIGNGEATTLCNITYLEKMLKREKRI